jgi:hypothetical protein
MGTSARGLALKDCQACLWERLATLRGEGHHRQSTWGGMRTVSTVVDTVDTNKREGRCLVANIHLNSPHKIRFGLENRTVIVLPFTIPLETT